MAFALNRATKKPVTLATGLIEIGDDLIDTTNVDLTGYYFKAQVLKTPDFQLVLPLLTYCQSIALCLR
ncbi:MAG: hypothetical protein ACI808_000241 [Paraglaciecola sp.]|jgi:hypothetical protein